MTFTTVRRGTLLIGLVAAVQAPVRAAAQEAVDRAAIDRLKEEGFGRSQVMDLMSWLTDVHGPRLTGSPITKAAGDWAIDVMKRWGLQNVDYEWWGPFGRGWVNERFGAQVTAPVPFPVIGYPNAWSESTKGRVKGGFVIVDLAFFNHADTLAAYRGKLKGQFLLARPEPTVTAQFAPPARRFSQEELDRMAAAPAPTPGQGGFRRPQPPPPADPTKAVSPAQLQQFLFEEGVLAVISPGRGSGGTVFPAGGGSRAADAPRTVPAVSLSAEHYGRIYRMVTKGVTVQMELEVVNRFNTDDLKSFNIVGEIPGTDRADEVVMLGAHFDSWHTGTGATDNAAGSAVMMEAMRILKASGLPMRRTIRIGLWTGEEQGLLGARAYVKAHFGDGQAGTTTPEHAKISGYYNLDNGTGAIRGVYLQGNEAIRPVFAEWMKALDSDSITVRHTTLANTGGTDHLAFDALRIPGFQFIQDPIEYDTRTHHSNMDVYERILPADLRHNAVVVAAFVYLTANRPDLLPRKSPPPATP
ncbi:MAG: M20/M25/M40 family metallo-hydrolase [Gemmatimonadetes bacterium]|nr:M20/M25/M40 family metallo-hydrolase [Gemmatimonadota bacterium]